MATESLASQMQARRSENMRAELEAVALRLFEERGFGTVTVEAIAAAANSSSRTFYRYFPSKEDVFQVRIDQRTVALRAALAARPVDEPAFQSLREAWTAVLAEEDLDVLFRWVSVIAATPSVLRGVLGGIQLKSQRVVAEFFGTRLGLASDSLVPMMLAAASGGVVQAGHTHWFLHGGDLAAFIADGLSMLESGDPQAWLDRTGQPP